MGKFFVDVFDFRLIDHFFIHLGDIAIKESSKIKWNICEMPIADIKFLFPTDPVPARGLVEENLQSPKYYEIDFVRIQERQDVRTTCMIRNIPNKYNQQMLIDLIDETHRGEYNFIYLRMDFKNKCNVGYAFINFINPLSIISFGRRMIGLKWPHFNSDKICHLTYARIQGLSDLMDKFRYSR